MGMIDGLFGLLFGNGRNVVKETVTAFRENADLQGARSTDVQLQAIEKHAEEFAASRRGWFDVLIDGLNRLPRPLLALGTLALFIAAMVDPIWFAERMQGIALVPEPLWWLLGVIVSFYFGARHQIKSQQFQREIARSVSKVPQVVENIQALRALRFDDPGAADTGSDADLQVAALAQDGNAALQEWQSRAA